MDASIRALQSWENFEGPLRRVSFLHWEVMESTCSTCLEQKDRIFVLDSMTTAGELGMVSGRESFFYGLYIVSWVCGGAGA